MFSQLGKKKTKVIFPPSTLKEKKKKAPVLDHLFLPAMHQSWEQRKGVGRGILGVSAGKLIGRPWWRLGLPLVGLLCPFYQYWHASPQLQLSQNQITVVLHGIH